MQDFELKYNFHILFCNGNSMHKCPILQQRPHTIWIYSRRHEGLSVLDKFTFKFFLPFSFYYDTCKIFVTLHILLTFTSGKCYSGRSPSFSWDSGIQLESNKLSNLYLIIRYEIDPSKLLLVRDIDIQFWQFSKNIVENTFLGLMIHCNESRCPKELYM